MEVRGREPGNSKTEDSFSHGPHGTSKFKMGAFFSVIIVHTFWVPQVACTPGDNDTRLHSFMYVLLSFFGCKEQLFFLVLPR
jgi:hypothetical protein